MMHNTPLQIDRVREHNRLLVYGCLKQHGKLSRTDIAQLTHLSIPTVSTILQGFLETELVEEVGTSKARGGRPAQLIRFKPDACFVLSIDLAQSHYKAALINLLGVATARFTGAKRRVGGEADLLDWLQTLHDDLTPQHRIGHLAVAVPGVVEPEGRVHLAPALGWHHYPLAETLERKFGYKVTLENDVNALALAELHYGQGSLCRNVLYLSITSGIGMGLVINGQIYRGSTFAAGEVGYSTLKHIRTQGNPNFGEPGALEAHLMELADSFRCEGRLDLSTDTARAAFDHFCADLTVILQNAICLLNPERLVVLWPDDPEGRLCEHLKTHLSIPSPIAITPAALGLDSALLGVARLALDALEETLCSAQRDEA